MVALVSSCTCQHEAVASRRQESKILAFLHALFSGCTLEQARAQLTTAGLHGPFVAKPLWADGREGAHGLAVLQDERGVEQLLKGDAPEGLQGPLLLSQYVDHGGCLFKVVI